MTRGAPAGPAGRLFRAETVAARAGACGLERSLAAEPPPRPAGRWACGVPGVTARCVSRCCSGLAWYWSGTGAAGPHGGAEPVLTLRGVEIVLHFSEHPVTPSPGRNTPPWPRGPRPLWEQKSQQGRARHTQIFGSGGAAVCGRQPPAPEPGVVTHAGDFRRDPEGCRRRPVPASHPPPAPRLTCAPGPWGRRSGPARPGSQRGAPVPSEPRPSRTPLTPSRGRSPRSAVRGR